MRRWPRSWLLVIGVVVTLVPSYLTAARLLFTWCTVTVFRICINYWDIFCCRVLLFHVGCEIQFNSQLLMTSGVLTCLPNVLLLRQCSFSRVMQSPPVMCIVPCHLWDGGKMCIEYQVCKGAEQLFTCKLGGWKPTHSGKSLAHSRLNGLIDYFSNFGKMILRKIIKIAATRCHILKLKCTKFDFGLGEPTSKRRGGEGRGRERKREGREREKP